MRSRTQISWSLFTLAIAGLAAVGAAPLSVPPPAGLAEPAAAAEPAPSEATPSRAEDQAIAALAEPYEPSCGLGFPPCFFSSACMCCLCNGTNLSGAVDGEQIPPVEDITLPSGERVPAP